MLAVDLQDSQAASAKLQRQVDTLQVTCMPHSLVYCLEFSASLSAMHQSRPKPRWYIKVKGCILFLQDKLQVATTANSQHGAAIVALKKVRRLTCSLLCMADCASMLAVEQDLHIGSCPRNIMWTAIAQAHAASVKADRSMREEGMAGGAAAVGAAAKGSGAKSGLLKDGAAAGKAAVGGAAASGAQQQHKGGKQKQTRKQGAALLPQRKKAARQDANSQAGTGDAKALRGSSSDGSGWHAGDLSSLAAGNVAVGAGPDADSTRGGSGSAGSGTELDHHAQQQVLAGRDPKRIVAAAGGSSAKVGAGADALTEVASADPARLANAHAAVLAAKKRQHAEAMHLASSADKPDAAAGLAAGSGIAGAVSGMTAEQPTDGLGSGPELSEGRLNGAVLADAHGAVQSAKALLAAAARGFAPRQGVIHGGVAGSLLAGGNAIAPASAAAAEARTAEIGARELVCFSYIQESQQFLAMLAPIRAE